MPDRLYIIANRFRTQRARCVHLTDEKVTRWGQTVITLCARTGHAVSGRAAMEGGELARTAPICQLCKKERDKNG